MTSQRIYRVENDDGIGSMKRENHEPIKDLLIHYLMCQTGMWAFGPSGRALGLTAYRTLSPCMKFGAPSIDALRQWFPIEHKDLDGFHISVYEVDEERIEAQLEVAFDTRKARLVERIELADFFSAVTPQQRATIDANILDYLLNAEARTLAFLRASFPTRKRRTPKHRKRKQ